MFEPRRVAPRRGAQLGWEKRLTDADDEQHEEPLVQRKRWACLRFAGANASAGRVSDSRGPTQALGAVSPIRGGQRKRWACLRFAGANASAGSCVSDSQGPTQALGAVSPIRGGPTQALGVSPIRGGQRKRWACLRFACGPSCSDRSFLWVGIRVPSVGGGSPTGETNGRHGSFCKRAATGQPPVSQNENGRQSAYEPAQSPARQRNSRFGEATSPPSAPFQKAGRPNGARNSQGL
jgi:hypothetical protein